MFELVVEVLRLCCVLLIYKIFKRGFLHDSKRADNHPGSRQKFVLPFEKFDVPEPWFANSGDDPTHTSI